VPEEVDVDRAAAGHGARLVSFGGRRSGHSRGPGTAGGAWDCGAA
jgi:hypothetical protein